MTFLKPFCAPPASIAFEVIDSDTVLTVEDQVLTVQQIVEFYTGGHADVVDELLRGRPEPEYDSECFVNPDGSLDEDFIGDILVDPMNTLSLDRVEGHLLLDSLQMALGDLSDEVSPSDPPEPTPVEDSPPSAEPPEEV